MSKTKRARSARLHLKNCQPQSSNCAGWLLMGKASTSEPGSWEPSQPAISSNKSEKRRGQPLEPLLHDIFEEARELQTPIEQVSFWDRLAESGTISEGEFFLPTRKQRLGNGCTESWMIIWRKRIRR
jgi:hypothetical protein